MYLVTNVKRIFSTIALNELHFLTVLSFESYQDCNLRFKLTEKLGVAILALRLWKMDPAWPTGEANSCRRSAQAHMVGILFYSVLCGIKTVVMLKE